MVLALLLPSPTFAFTPTQPHSPATDRLFLKTTATNKLITSRNFALSARDTIFSLNDDDDDEKSAEINTVDSSDIEDIVNNMMAEENTIDDIVNGMKAEENTDNDDSGETTKRIGDPLREDNGVRPSIHPTAINAIAEALKARASQAKKKKIDDDDMMYFRVTDTVEPLMVMVTAGQFASDAIQKRQESSEEDGMLLTQGEE